MLDNILTKASLAEKVESLVKSEKMSYIEAVIHICNEMGVDPADIGKL
ncbi:MAG: late promoter transcription accessory protein, partial [bacterium]